MARDNPFSPEAYAIERHSERSSRTSTNDEDDQERHQPITPVGRQRHQRQRARNQQAAMAEHEEKLAKSEARALSYKPRPSSPDDMSQLLSGVQALDTMEDNDLFSDFTPTFMEPPDDVDEEDPCAL